MSISSTSDGFAYPVDTTRLDTTRSGYSPLAEFLRPKTLEDIVGQRHLLAPGKPLQLVLVGGQLHSMILWGPPGVGKTTLARLFAHTIEAEFISLSAVFSGVKDIRTAIDQASIQKNLGRRTILFIDEIHRFNKAQQDAFLPYVESGLITLIGASTENPSFECNKALLSRVQVYVLQPLSADDLKHLVHRAQQTYYPRLHFDETAIHTLVNYADGDARRLLNLLEQAASAAETNQCDHLDAHFLKALLTANPRRFDKTGDVFYDQISALHKSVRGSSPDGALYWLCRMLDGGVDPRYLARRILRMAWEDIGLADPRAMQIARDAAETYERLGSPEGELALAQAVIYLAIAPKSNAGYMAYQAARAHVAQDTSREVPLHLRNASTQLMEKLAYGQHYRYPHDEPEAYAAGETYLPEGKENVKFYKPTPYGLEGKIAEKLKQLAELDRAWREKQ